jgi:hypothetical protein
MNPRNVDKVFLEDLNMGEPLLVRRVGLEFLGGAVVFIAPAPHELDPDEEC